MRRSFSSLRSRLCLHLGQAGIRTRTPISILQNQKDWESGEWQGIAAFLIFVPQRTPKNRRSADEGALNGKGPGSIKTSQASSVPGVVPKIA